MIRRPFGPPPASECRPVAVAAALAMAAMTLAEGQPAPQAQPSPAAQASAPAASASAGLYGIKAAVDYIEKSVSGAQTEDELVALKRRLAPLREELRERAAQLELRLKEIDQRLGEFGTPPTGPGVQAAPRAGGVVGSAPKRAPQATVGVKPPPAGSGPPTPADGGRTHRRRSRRCRC